MANVTAPPPAPTTAARFTGTTARGLATVSFCFGFWGTLVFWWYPYGPVLGGIGAAIATVALGLGIRSGRHGENLALGGLFFGSTAVGMGITAFRFMQAAFEGYGPYGLY